MTKKVMREANLRAVKDPFREEMAVEKAATPESTAMAKALVGVDGWLIFPLIGFSLQIVQQAGGVYDGKVTATDALFVAVCNGGLLFGLVKQKRWFPWAWGISIALTPVLYLACLLLGQLREPKEIVEFFVSCFAAAVWIPYLLLSKRVRNTFYGAKVESAKVELS